MAGLYAAWRLLERGVPPDRIAVFEVDGRIGGRVFTVRAPQWPGLVLDMGAHNFGPSHQIVSGLVERFGLKTTESLGHSPDGIVHLRGRSLTNREIAGHWFRKPFAYGVSAYVQRRGPARMLRKALEKMPVDTDGKTRRLGGRPLADWALPDALLQVLSPEELRYLTDRLIYSFWHTPVQAEAALSWVAQEIFTGRNRMAELSEGMAALPEALAGAIAQSGAAIELRYRLTQVELPADGTGPTVLSFATAAGARSVAANRVVLALPAAAIERVAGVAGRPEIEALCAAILPQQAIMTALVYEEPWWQQIGIASGASTTDLPARHLRHHYAEPDQGKTLRPGALVSYSDGGSADFWRNAGTGEPSYGWIGADHPVARELHSQAQKMFEPKVGRRLPPPVDAFTQDWSEKGPGAAFHLWAAGSKPDTSSADALQPIGERNLHICGEAWSMRQGWIEGALETVDALISRHMAAG